MVSLSCWRSLANFPLKLRTKRLRRLLRPGVALLFASLLYGQVANPAHKPAAKPQTQKVQPSPQEVLQQHYDAARTFQLSGDNEHAAAEYSAFLVSALREEANGYFHLGQADKAALLFEDALRLSKSDTGTLLDYALMRF